MNDDDVSEEETPRTVSDYAREHWYTVFPTLYVDEDSTVNDLLWQQVLEQRAHRLTLLWITLIVPLSLIVVGLLLSLFGSRESW